MEERRKESKLIENVRLEVKGTGQYLPKRVVKTEDFEGQPWKAYDASGNVIKEGTHTADNVYEITGAVLANPEKGTEQDLSRGIVERHYAAPGETPATMGTKAAIAAIEDSGIDQRSLTGIILSTVSQKANFPSGAIRIQKAISEHYGVKIEECMAYDLAGACAGSPLAIADANARVLRRPGNYLVVSAEDVSGMWKEDDKDRILFGAGAGAVVMTPSKDRKGVVGEYTISDPFDGKDEWILRDAKTLEGRMPQGRRVLREAKRRMLEAAEEVKRQAGWKKADVYIPHQANGRIIDLVEKEIGKEGGIVYRNISKTGNVSSATCLLALDDARRDGTIKEGSKVVLTSFGGGLITSAVALQF